MKVKKIKPEEQQKPFELFQLVWCENDWLGVVIDTDDEECNVASISDGTTMNIPNKDLEPALDIEVTLSGKKGTDSRHSYTKDDFQ